MTEASRHDLEIPKESILSGASNKSNIPVPFKSLSLYPSSDFQRKTRSFVIDLAQVGHSQINLPTHHALVQEQWDAARNVFNIRLAIASPINSVMSLPPLVHFRLVELEASYDMICGGLP